MFQVWSPQQVLQLHPVPFHHSSKPKRSPKLSGGISALHSKSLLLGRKKKPVPQKTGPGSQRFPEFCGTAGRFCRMVLQEGSGGRFCRKVHIARSLLKERFCRNFGVLQNFGSQAQLFRPCKFFSHLSP